MSSSSDLVHLNVGGVLYTTKVFTLTQYPDSMLGAMFKGNIPSQRDTNGCVFIDRDGPLFRHVLNFLRCTDLNLPEDFRELSQLHAEADFYQICPLIEKVEMLQKRLETKDVATNTSIVSGTFIEVQQLSDYGDFNNGNEQFEYMVMPNDVPTFINSPVNRRPHNRSYITVFAFRPFSRTCKPLTRLEFHCDRPDDDPDLYASDYFHFVQYGKWRDPPRIADEGLESAFVPTTRAEFGAELESCGWKKVEHVSVPIAGDGGKTVGLHVIEKWFLPVE